MSGRTHNAGVGWGHCHWTSIIIDTNSNKNYKYIQSFVDYPNHLRNRTRAPLGIPKGPLMAYPSWRDPWPSRLSVVGINVGPGAVDGVGGEVGAAAWHLPRAWWGPFFHRAGVRFSMGLGSSIPSAGVVESTGHSVSTSRSNRTRSTSNAGQILPKKCWVFLIFFT